MTNESIFNKFDPTEYRQALGSFATGVTVITAATESGELAGITANSFTSVSLDPPLILWCLATTSESLGIFKDSSHFAVNILAADQINMSVHFATKQADKFSSVSYEPGQGAAPLLTGCATWLQCRTASQYELGDHWVIVGEVIQFKVTGKETLLYHQGNYALSLPYPELEARLQDKYTHYQHSGLYSLLLKAAHTYQEKFEQRQHEYIENNYEARILLSLHETNRIEITDASRVTQLSSRETHQLIDALQEQGLIEIDKDDGTDLIMLTEQGKNKAATLWELARQHEQDAVGLFSQDEAKSFKKNLLKLIKWPI